MSKKPLMLCILDGFGWVPDKSYGNAILAAKTPNLDRLFAEYPHPTIGASAWMWACRTARWATAR